MARCQDGTPSAGEPGEPGSLIPGMKGERGEIGEEVKRLLITIAENHNNSII